MSANNFIPEIWVARVLYNFRKTFIFRSLVNSDYEGEITGAGDTVNIVTPSAIAVNDYTGTVTYEEIQSSLQKMVIDQLKSWGFKVPDIKKLQANINLADTFMIEAANAMANTVDANLASLSPQAGNTVSLDISSVYTGVRPALIDCGQALDDAGVPDEGRYLVASTTMFAGIRKASDYTPASEMGDEIKRTGAVGHLEGFDIYKSRNVQVATQHKCLAGHKSAITFAEQLVETETLRDQDSFADLVRGLMVFGRKVVRPGALVLLDTTVA